MSFESYLVSTAYSFSSNSKLVVGGIAKDAAQAAKNLDLLSVAVDRADTAITAFTENLQRARASFSEFIVGAGRASVAADDITLSMRAAGRGATATGTQFGAASKVIGDEVGVAAARVSESATVITSRLGAVTAAAERSAVAMRGVGAAGGGIGGGAGGAGGGAGRSAGGHGNLGIGGILGLGALATLGFGIGGAANMQNATLQTAIATGKFGKNFDATMDNMKPTVDMAYKMSAITGGSVGDMMTVVQNMASSGFTEKQLTTLSKPIAQLTDILHYGKDRMGFGEAATLGAGVAHTLQLFNQSDAHFGFEKLAQLGYESPHGTAQLATQIRRFAPQFENMLPGNTKQKAGQIMEYTAWLDRMGALQFGGSGLNMLATYLQHPKTRAQRSAMGDLGLLDPRTGRNLYMDQKTGIYRLPQALEQVAKAWSAADKNGIGRGRINTDIGSLSQNASRILALLTKPNALIALQNIRNQSRHMPGLDEMQKQLMQTLTHAWGRFTTNVETLATTIGAPLLKPLGKFIGALADATSAITDFVRAHPMAQKLATGAVLGGAAYGAVKLWQMIGGIFAFGSVAAHHAKDTLRLGGGVHFRHGAHGARNVAAVAGDTERDLLINGSRATRVATGAHFEGSLVGRTVRSIGQGLLDILTFKDTRGLIGKGVGRLGLSTDSPAMNVFFRPLGAALRMLGGDMLNVVRPTMWLGGLLTRFGLKFIPVVGEVMLAIDAIKFFGAHAKDIGRIIADIAHWIIRTGGPMLVNAFVQVVKFIAKSVIDTFMGLFNGGHGGLWDFARTIVGYYNSESKRLDNADRHHRPGPTYHGHHAATHGMRGNHQYAYVQGSGEGGMVVNGGLTVQVQKLHTEQDYKEVVKAAHRKVDRGSIPKSTPGSPSLRSGTIAGMQFGHA